jgi:hypothetical protein
MLQRMQSPKGGTITAANTTATAFPTIPALMLYVYAPSANAGTVKIGDAAGITGGNLGGGITIPKGLVNFPIGPILNLESLAYQFTSAGDTLEYLLIG